MTDFFEHMHHDVGRPLRSSLGSGPRGNGIFLSNAQYEYENRGVYEIPIADFKTDQRGTKFLPRVGDVILVKTLLGHLSKANLLVVTALAEDQVVARSRAEWDIATQYETPDGSVSDGKLADQAVIPSKIADEVATVLEGATGNAVVLSTHGGTFVLPIAMDDGTIDPTSISPHSISRDMLRSDAVPTMSATTKGIAKLGPGLSITDEGVLELDGSGDIATAVSAWLTAHPEAYQPIADGSVSNSKMAANAIKNVNVASDAKITIDKMAWQGTQVSLVLNDGYFSANGSINPAQSETQLEYYTDPISVTPGERLRVSFTSPDGTNLAMWGAYVEYFPNDMRTARTIFINGSMPSFEFEYEASPGVSSVAFCFRSYGYQNRFLVCRMSPLPTIFGDVNGNGVAHVYLSSGGNLTSSPNYMGMIAPVPVVGGQTYTYLCDYSPHPLSAKMYAWHLDSSGTIIDGSDFDISNATNYLPGFSEVVPADCAYVYVNVYKNNGITIDEDSFITVTPGIEGTVPNDVESRLSMVRAAVEDEITVGLSDGYITADGGIHGATVDNEVYTDMIPLSDISSVRLEIRHDSPHVAWAVYALYDDDGTFISRPEFTRSRYADTTALVGSLTESMLDGASFLRMSWRTYDGCDARVLVMRESGGIDSKIDGAKSFERSWLDRPVYDHLFVTDGTRTVPHESLFHVRLSHRLGYKVIEANVCWSKDEEDYYVNHLSSWKFGTYFKHRDGVTDISNEYFASYTTAQLDQDIVYNSTIQRYRVKPTKLEDFLRECRKNDMVPFVSFMDKPRVQETVNRIMGIGNYIAYGATRALNPDAWIYHWVSNLTTKQDIIDYCENVGRPFIFGWGNTTSFTDDDIRDIVGELHKRGFLVGTSYADDRWHRLSGMGFDFNGSQHLANRLDHADVVNATSVFDFSQFSVTGGTQSSDGLYFANGGTIAPLCDPVPNGVYVADVEVSFSGGTITVPAIGKMSSGTYSSDGSSPWFQVSPVIGDNPVKTITVGSGTTIRDISYLVARA